MIKMLNTLQTVKTNRGAVNHKLKVGFITSLINNKYGEPPTMFLHVKSRFGTSTIRTSRGRMDGWRRCCTQQVRHSLSSPPSLREPVRIFRVLVSVS